MIIKPFDFVIASIPFQGQYAIVEILKAFGINCSIQQSVDFWCFSSSLSGSVNELYGDASWFSAPYLNKLKPSTIVLHQTISPSIAIPYLEKSQIFQDWETDYLNSYTKNYNINKYVKYQGRNWNWPESIKERVELFYIKWNEMIEENSKNKKYMRFKADLLNEETVEKIFWFIGAKINEENITKVVNSLNLFQINNKKELLSERLTEIAKRYDYL